MHTACLKAAADCNAYISYYTSLGSFFQVFVVDSIRQIEKSKTGLLKILSGLVMVSYKLKDSGKSVIVLPLFSAVLL